MWANLGWTEILILAGLVVVFFGAKRFPDIGRNVGLGISNLYRSVTGAVRDETPALPPPEQKDNSRNP